MPGRTAAASPRDSFATTDSSSLRGAVRLDNKLAEQATQLLSDRSFSQSVFSAGTAPTSADKLNGTEIAANGNAKGGGAGVITEAEAHTVSHDRSKMQAMDGDQAQQIAEMSPTSESMKTLTDRNMDKAVDLASSRPDVAAVSEHNDDLPDSFTIN